MVYAHIKIYKHYSVVTPRVDRWLYIVYQPAREFFAHIDMSPLPVKG